MKKLIYLLSLGLIITAFSACDLQNSRKIIDANEKVDVQSLLNDLNNIGDKLRESSATFNDKAIVKKIAKEYYGKVAYERFISGYTRQPASKNETAKITKFQKQLITEINRYRLNASSPEDYIQKLNSKFNEVEESSISTAKKQKALVYVAANIAGIKFMSNNIDLVSPYSTSENVAYLFDNWWDDWGRCVAGTLGGAITGGLSGCAVSAVPTAGFGCPAGAAVGAIGGALTGAAASC